MILDEAEIVMNIIEHGFVGDLTPEAVMVYIDGILDLPYMETRKTIKRASLTQRFRPTISEIRAGVAEQMGLLPPSVEEATAQALDWMEYQDQLQYVNGSGYQPVKPRVHEAVVRTCAMVSSPDHSSWNAMFKNAYKAISEEVTNKALIDPMDSALALEAGF